MVTLPVELIERIIDYDADDPSTLKECALASSVFLLRCRVHQFRKVVLHTPTTYRHFKDLIDTRPHISKLVKCLVFKIFTIYEPNYDGGPLPILQILDQLPNARRLLIQPKVFHGLWYNMPHSTRTSLKTAFSRPGITQLSLILDLYSPRSHQIAQNLLRLCAATKYCHLELFGLKYKLSRASKRDALVKVDSLCLFGLGIGPSELVPDSLPLLDLRHLRYLRLGRTHLLASHEWIAIIAKLCSYKLRTLSWKPNNDDIVNEHAEVYPISQLPVLKYLIIDLSRHQSSERNIPFLRRFLASRSSKQVLRSLTIHYPYPERTEGDYETFVEQMKGFLRDLTNVDDTVLYVWCYVGDYVGDEESHRAARERFRNESGLGGEYPGTRCVLKLK